MCDKFDVCVQCAESMIYCRVYIVQGVDSRLKSVESMLIIDMLTPSLSIAFYDIDG